MQQKSIVGNVVAVIFFGVLMVIFFIADKDFLLKKEPTDIFQHIEEAGAPQKGEYVSIGVDAVLEYYAETKHTTNGIPTGKEKHYLLWLDDTSFISLTVSGKKNYEKLDEIMNATYDYLDEYVNYLPMPVEFTGRVSTMNSEIEGYYQEALDYWGISEEDGMTAYYVSIDATRTPSSSWMLLGVLALIEVIAVFVLVKDIKHNRMVKSQAAAARATAMLYDNSERITDDNNNLYS